MALPMVTLSGAVVTVRFNIPLDRHIIDHFRDEKDGANHSANADKTKHHYNQQHVKVKKRKYKKPLTHRPNSQ